MEPRRVKATALETAEELQRLAKSPEEHSGPMPTLGNLPPVQGSEPIPFRPVVRPPQAVLCILDDDQKEGELVRMRGSRLLIGRSEGDVVIPHDDAISGQHAEILRSLENGQYKWHLRDLGSTNGTFVRCQTARLKQNQELLIGCQRYQFRLPATASLPAAPAADEKSTRGWQAVSREAVSALAPLLVHLDGPHDGRSFPLTSNEHWIGRDPRQTSVTLDQDSMVSPRHARIFKAEKDEWKIEDARSANGIWIRVEKALAGKKFEFQLGEQRFVLKLPS